MKILDIETFLVNISGQNRVLGRSRRIPGKRLPRSV
jgi:hypothetical protein